MDAFQRLLEGLQQTLQIFKVYGAEDVERGNTHEELCGQTPSDTHPFGNDFKGNQPPVPLDNRKYFVAEKELDSFEYEPENFKILPAELLTTRSLKHKICGPSGTDPSFVKHRPGERVSFAEQELYNTSISDQQNLFKEIKQPTGKNKPLKMQTCSIEETELSDGTIIRCKKPQGKGDDKDVQCSSQEQLPSSKSKYRDQEELGDAMETHPKISAKQRRKKESELPLNPNQPRKKTGRGRESADRLDHKNSTKENESQETQMKTRKTEKQSPKESGKKKGSKLKGCCKGCCSRCRKKEKQNPKTSGAGDYDKDSSDKKQRSKCKRLMNSCLGKTKKNRDKSEKPSSKSKQEKESYDDIRKGSFKRTKGPNSKKVDDSYSGSLSSIESVGKSSSKKTKKPFGTESLVGIIGCYRPRKGGDGKSHLGKGRLEDNMKSESSSSIQSGKNERPRSFDKKKRVRNKYSREAPGLEDFDTKNISSARRSDQPDDLKKKTAPRRERSRKPKELENFDTEKISPKKEEQPKHFHRQSSLEQKERPGVISFDTGRPREDTEHEDIHRESSLRPGTLKKELSKDFNHENSSGRESLKEDEKIKEYFFQPKGRKVRKGEEPPDEHLNHVEYPTDIDSKSFKKTSVQSEANILDVPGSTKDKLKGQADFVLCFLTKNDELFGETLECYLENIEKQGLLVESVSSRNYKNTTYIKVSIPLETALSLANDYGIKLACMSPYYKHRTACCMRLLCFGTTLTSPNPKTKVYIRNKESVKGLQPTEPTSAERIMILYEVLKASKFGNCPEEFGVQEMKRLGIIATAYPLHDGECKWTKKGPLNDRQLLKAYWGNIFSMFKIHPIQLIKKYFGPEAGYSFALMEFYIKMLIPAAVIGLMSFLYGFSTVNSTDNLRIQEFCKRNNQLMCPICKTPKLCTYFFRDTSCNYCKLNYLFDNIYTMVCAIVMPFCGILFITLWRRKENTLRVAWNLHQCFTPDPTTRPSYYEKAPIGTEKEEQYPYTTEKVQKIMPWMVSLSGMFIMIFLILLTMFLIIFFRITVMTFWSNSEKLTQIEFYMYLRGKVCIKTAIAGAVLSSVIIIILDNVFDIVASFLTKIENPRTQVEFDHSYLAKTFIFSFFNNYTIAIYLALFRGFGYTYPGDKKMWDYFYGINADLCDASGCVADLWIFLFVITIFRAIINFFKILVVPSLYKLCKKTTKRPHKKTVDKSARNPQWETDYDLKPISHYYFANLNMQLIIQYGFVIFFIAAFPLLAFIVLILNIIEIRANALVLVRFYQRPIPRQTCDMEMWNKMLKAVTFIGILVNALVAGLTINYVEQELFKSEHNTLKGYWNSTMSKFPISSYSNKNEKRSEFCHYPRKRSPGSYVFLAYHHIVTAMRGLFIVVLTVVVVISGVIIYNTVSTTPNSVRKKINYQQSKGAFRK